MTRTYYRQLCCEPSGLVPLWFSLTEVNKSIRLTLTGHRFVLNIFKNCLFLSLCRTTSMRLKYIDLYICNYNLGGLLSEWGLRWPTPAPYSYLSNFFNIADAYGKWWHLTYYKKKATLNTRSTNITSLIQSSAISWYLANSVHRAKRYLCTRVLGYISYGVLVWPSKCHIERVLVLKLRERSGLLNTNIYP